MYNKKIRINLSSNVLQPTIAITELTEDEFYDIYLWKDEDHDLYLVEETTKQELECQISSADTEATPMGNKVKYSMYILVNNLQVTEKEQSFSFNIEKKPKEKVILPDGHSYNPWGKTKGVFLENQEINKRVIVCINGALFTRYLYSHDLAKPYFNPLIGPAGKTLINNEADDHLHHHGLWWGHDSVNGH